MALRNYINTGSKTVLSVACTAADTTVQVGDPTVLPASVPFTMSLDLGATLAEAVLVTAVSGHNLTVTRGYDSTTAAAHAAGADAQFVVVAKDYSEANTHVNSDDGVHGVTGSVVGTSDTQTLTNKTLTSPTVTGTMAAAAATFSGAVTASGSVTASDGLTTTDVTASGDVSVAGALTVNDVAVVVGADSGWVSTGFTMENSTTTSLILIRSIGDVVTIYVEATLGIALTGGNGDYGNTAVFQVPSAFVPTYGQGLGSGGYGAHTGAYINTSGVVQIVSGPTAGMDSGAPFSVAGTYFLG